MQAYIVNAVVINDKPKVGQIFVLTNQAIEMMGFYPFFALGNTEWRLVWLMKFHVFGIFPNEAMHTREVNNSFNTTHPIII